MDGQHHISLRNRTTKTLDPFPHPDGFKRFFDRVMYVVSVGVPLALVPQVLQVYETQDVGDLSLVTWSLLCFFNVLWTMYGFLHKEFPILISSAVTGTLQFSLVLAILLFS